LTAVLLAGAVNSYGQPHNDRVDYGTSLLEAMKIEDSHHAAWKAYFDKENVDAKTEYGLSYQRCYQAMSAKDDNAACFKAIASKQRVRMSEIRAERCQEDGDYQKHVIDIRLHYRKEASIQLP
jgi:hypothetical protein